jgi:hypothetical protein
MATVREVRMREAERECSDWMQNVCLLEFPQEERLQITYEVEKAVETEEQAKCYAVEKGRRLVFSPDDGPPKESHNRPLFVEA